MTAIPTPWYGHFNGEYRQDLIELLAAPARDRGALQTAVAELGRLADCGAVWPQTFAAADGKDHAYRYWTGLARGIVAVHEQGILPGRERNLGDLAHWTGRALADLERDGRRLPLEATMDAMELHLLAGEVEPATRRLAVLAASELQDDTLAETLQHLVDGAVACGRPDLAVACLDREGPALEARIGGSYELAAITFKALAAAQAGSQRLLVAAEAMKKANRKSFRHDLSREPLWQVTLADPGTLLDTHEAAQRIDRPVNFLAKRLENGTIPFHRVGDQIRIPEQALLAWKAVMDAHQLLD